MATTQPWATGGSLLAGIGGANTNAPQASDVNATLGLIRQNNEFARAGVNNVGLQALQGLQGLSDAYKQNQQTARQKAFQQEYGNAFKSGDRAAMRDLAAKYPDQFESVQKVMGFIDDDHCTTMGNLAMNVQVAAGQGPEAFGNFLKSNATELNRIGVNPADVGQTYQKNPQGAADLFGNLAMFSLGPKDYLDELGKRENRSIQRGQWEETSRHNQASEGLQAQQMASSNYNSVADRHLRKLELEKKMISNRLDQAKTIAETERLNMQLADNEQKRKETLQQKDMALGYMKEASQISKDLYDDPGLGDITGTIAGRTFTFIDASQDLINKAQRLQSLLTQENLKMMTGVLTDRDITFLGNIASGINVGDNGIRGSEKGTRDRLKAITRKLNERIASTFSPSLQPNDSETSGNQQPANPSSSNEIME